MDEYYIFRPDTLYMVDRTHGLYTKINGITTADIEHHLSDNFRTNGKTVTIETVDAGPMCIQRFGPEVSTEEFEHVLLEGGAENGEA